VISLVRKGTRGGGKARQGTLINWFKQHGGGFVRRRLGFAESVDQKNGGVYKTLRVMSKKVGG